MPTVTATQATSIMGFERRCRDSFAYAAAKTLWIRPKHQALQLLTLNWPQRYVNTYRLEPKWSRREPIALLVLKTRRVGMTTEFVGFDYHKVRWFRGQNCYIVAQDDPTITEIFEMVLRFHDNMPPDFVPTVDKHNTERLSYAAPWDSSIRARIAQHHEVGRGSTLHHVLLDEVAYYPDPSRILLGVLEAVPRTTASSLIMSSTANGADTWFEAVWHEFSRHPTQEGWGGRQWETVFLPWFWNPYNIVTGYALRDITPDEVELQREHHLTDPQLLWRRGAIQEYEKALPGMGHRRFQQENPSTPEEAFLLAGDCIFPEDALKRLQRQERAPSLGFTIHRIGTWTCALVAHKDLDTAPFLVWEPPTKGYRYALGVDVSRGVGRDDSAVVVVRMPGFRMVAQWFDNYTAPKQLAYVVAAIGRYYGVGSGDMPICTVEVNDAGILVNAELETLRGAEPIDLFVWEYWDKVGGSQQSTKTGWLTTQITKNLLVGVANSLLMAEMCHVPSGQLRADMGRTIEVKAGLYRTGGCDLCIAWLLAMVTAYRKIARWEWDMIEGRKTPPVQVFPDGPGRPDDPMDSVYTETGDRTRHDTAWGRLMRNGRNDRTGLEVSEAIW